MKALRAFLSTLSAIPDLAWQLRRQDMADRALRQSMNDRAYESRRYAENRTAQKRRGV